MSKIILTESELKLRMAQIYKEEKLKQVKTLWEGFTKEEKIFVIEFYKELHPDSKLLSESKWYNWVGDIVGFIPGLEIVNIVNGVSYWKQGEKLFSLLSFLAGIPGLGLILNPVKGLIKGSGAVGKLLKGAVAAGDAGKLASLGKENSIIGKLIKSVGTWGGKLMGMLLKVGERVPFLKTIIKGVRGTVDVFTNAKNIMKSSGKNLKYSASKGFGDGSGTIRMTKMGGGPTSNDPFSNTISSIFGK